MRRRSAPNPPRDSGFTLLELLITLAILGVLLSVGAWNLTTLVQNQRAQDDAYAASSILKYAVSRVRTDNRSVTLAISGNTMTVSRGTTVLKAVTVNYTPTLTCAGTCPTNATFTLAAPFGQNDTDFKLTFSASRATRTLLVRGPLGWVNVQ